MVRARNTKPGAQHESRSCPKLPNKRCRNIVPKPQSAQIHTARRSTLHSQPLSHAAAAMHKTATNLCLCCSGGAAMASREHCSHTTCLVKPADCCSPRTHPQLCAKCPSRTQDELLECASVATALVVLQSTSPANRMLQGWVNTHTLCSKPSKRSCNRLVGCTTHPTTNQPAKKQEIHAAQRNLAAPSTPRGY